MKKGLGGGDELPSSPILSSKAYCDTPDPVTENVREEIVVGLDVRLFKLAEVEYFNTSR
jgi:hypothetical protein